VRFPALVAVILLMSTLAVASAKRDWMESVSEKDRVRKNPLAESADAAAAGEILFRRNCASCHGEDARGVGKRPSLRTERVRRATDGELHWLLTNGNLGEGMPSWSRLPDAQRWQLIRFLRSLAVEGAGQDEQLVLPR
jgi:mono/diheme cytochrome c family protein